MHPVGAQQGIDPVTQLPCTYYVYPPRTVAAPPAPPVVTQYARPEPTPVYTPQPTVKKTRVIRQEPIREREREAAGFRCGDDCANMECGPSQIWCNLLNPFALCSTLCPRPRTRDGKNPMDVSCTFRDACPCAADLMDWMCCYNCEPARVRRVRVEEPRAVMVEAPEVHTVCVECGEVLEVQSGGGCQQCHSSHGPPVSYGRGYDTVRGIPARRNGRGGYRGDVPPIPNGARSRYNY